MKLALLGFFPILILSLTNQARGLELSADLELAQGFSLLDLSIQGRSQAPKQDFYFADWFAAFGGTQSKSTDATSQQGTTYRGRNFAGGVGFAYGNLFDFALSVNSSSTPETRYAQSGGDIQVTYRQQFLRQSEMPPAELAEFSPEMTLGLGFGSARIQQQISFVILTQNVNRDIELAQRSAFVNFGLTPFDGIFLKILLKAFSYSRSKADLQAVYASRFLNNSALDLVSTIGGLPEYSSQFKAGLQLSKSWDVTLATQNTRLLVDDSLSKRIDLVFSKYFENWSLGFGGSRNETELNKEAALILNFSVSI